MLKLQYDHVLFVPSPIPDESRMWDRWRCISLERDEKIGMVDAMTSGEFTPVGGKTIALKELIDIVEFIKAMPGR